MYSVLLFKQENNLLGRDASNGSNLVSVVKWDIDFSITKFTFFNKFEKVLINTNEGNRVFEISVGI